MARILASGRGVAVIIDRNRNTAVLGGATAAVRVRDGRQVNTVTASTQTVAIAAPGPRGAQGDTGEQGPPGPAGGTATIRTASGALGGYRVVRSVSATLVGYADSQNPDHGDDTLGLTLNAAADGADVTVQSAGSVTFNGWAWTPGEPVFLGLNGLLTQTPPETGFVQQIGHAEDATTLFVDIDAAHYFED